MTNIVKSVEFMGDTLPCIKNELGVYVGIRWICQGLGLTDRQGKHQIDKIQNDIVLSKGIQRIVLPSNGGNQEAWCIEIIYLPLWLAKINANIVNINTQDKLVEYQLKCKDVLATAFVSQLNPQATPSIPQLPTTMQEALRQLADSLDTNAVNAPKVKGFDSFLASNGNQTIGQAAKALNTGRDRLFAWLRAKGLLMSNNEPYQSFVNLGYFDVVEGVNGGWLSSKTLITPRGIAYIDRLMHPIETMHDAKIFLDRLKA